MRSSRSAIGVSEPLPCFFVPAAAGKVVDERDLMTAGREPQGSRPAQVTVAPKDENAHRSRQGSGRRRFSRAHGIPAADGGALRRRPSAGGAASLSVRSSHSGWDCASRRDRTPGAGLRRGAYATISANSTKARDSPGEGPGATQPASNYSPGLPLFAAGFTRSAALHERAARIVLALLGSLAILLRLSARPATRRADSRADRRPPDGGLSGTLEYQGMLMTEPLAATLLAGAVLAFLHAVDVRRRTGPGWEPVYCSGRRDAPPRVPGAIRLAGTR